MSDESAFHTLGPWKNWGAFRAALLIPSDQNGRVLLQLRDRTADIAHPGKWGLFGGGVEAGESLLQAAMRELTEETGLTPPATAFCPLARTISPHSRSRLYVFALTLDITPADIRLSEGAGFGFLGQEDFARLDLVPAAQILLAYWARKQAREKQPLTANPEGSG